MPMEKTKAAMPMNPENHELPVRVKAWCIALVATKKLISGKTI